MQSACLYAGFMKTLQIRNVPDDVHARLKARAALEGMSLSELALGELRRAAERPSRRELLERVRGRSSARLRLTPERAVRAERDRG